MRRLKTYDHRSASQGGDVEKLRTCPCLTKGS